VFSKNSPDFFLDVAQFANDRIECTGLDLPPTHLDIAQRYGCLAAMRFYDAGLQGPLARRNGEAAASGFICDRSTAGRRGVGYNNHCLTLLRGHLMSMFDKADRRLRNMAIMIDRLGFNADALERGPLGAELNSAIRTCQACAAEEMCLEWLARAPMAIGNAPAFCPNKELFARARSQRAAR
jgi:hypothetical protein